MTAEGIPINSVLRTIVARSEHPDYDKRNFLNDFLILKLNAKVDLPYIRLNRNDDLPQDNAAVTVAGFGQTQARASFHDSSSNHTISLGDLDDLEEKEGTTSAHILQEVDVEVISNEKCSSDQMYGGRINKDAHLCAGLEAGGKDSCKGDSGGPLIMERNNNYLQVGVVSFGTGCARANRPGVYARVSSASTWIEDQICSLSDSPPSSCPGVGPRPSSLPSSMPSFEPSRSPSSSPNGYPSIIPSSSPSTFPSSSRSASPSELPTVSTVVDWTKEQICNLSHNPPSSCYVQPFLSSRDLRDAVDLYLANTDERHRSLAYIDLIEMHGRIEVWNVSLVTAFDNLFSAERNSNATSFNADLSKWKLDNAIDTHQMFLGASSFDSDLSHWNVDKVQRYQGMFDGARSFKGSGLDNWDVSSGLLFMVMFAGTDALNLPDISGWDVSNARNMKAMFRDSNYGSDDTDNGLCDWAEKLNSSVDVFAMFLRSNCPDTADPDLQNSPIHNFCSLCLEWTFPTDSPSKSPVPATISTISQKQSFISSRELSDAVDIYLANDEMYNDLVKKYGYIEDWNVSLITNFGNLFNKNRNLSATSFSADLSRWNMNSAMYLHDMFLGASSFDSDLSDWDVAKVIHFNGLFDGASSFKGKGLDKWDVGSGRLFMVMFSSTDSLNLPDISGWDVSNARNMKAMFRNSNFGSNDNTDNLCKWADKLGSTVNKYAMFMRSNCPDTGDPDMHSPVVRFCAPCTRFVRRNLRRKPLASSLQ
jgi:surface protein